MHIAVCVKQIPDPEVPSSQFRVDEAAKKADPIPGTSLVMSPFDAQAMEAALRIRDGQKDTRITAVTLGDLTVEDVLRHALALGADEGVLLSDSAFEAGDGFTTALVLSEAIKKIGGCDLILCGRQSADTDAGVVGLGIAELLGLPAVTFAKDIRVDGDRLRVERVLINGFETVEAPLPALVTIAHEIGEPRKPTLRDTIGARKKSVSVWSAADLGLEPSQVGEAGVRSTLERLFIPEASVDCEIVEGATVEEQAANLARRLWEADLL